LNTTTKAAIGVAIASFAVTMWALKHGSIGSQADPFAQEPAAVRPDAGPAPHDTPQSIPADFASAAQAAAQFGSTAEGLSYQDEAAPVLSRVLQERLSGCLVGASPLGPSAFAIVVAVAPDGAVGSTWASPETPLASCVIRRLAGAALPPPRVPDVFMAANVRPDATASDAESGR